MIRSGELERGSHSVVDDFFSPDEWRLAQAALASRREQGKFHAGGVGAGVPAAWPDWRRDLISWTNEDDGDLGWWREKIEGLRRQLNQELFLGLQDCESHFAIYEEGSFYRRHLDRFREDDRRMLSFVVYLNDVWESDWGGQLRLFLGDTPLDIQPVPNRAVFFLSGEVWHEVLPTRRARKSLTGWFRRGP